MAAVVLNPVRKVRHVRFPLWTLLSVLVALGRPLCAAEHGPLTLPDTREGSGTAWQPDSTPMHGVHLGHGAWMVMAHGNLFAGYQYEGSARGDAQWIAPNWAMLMERRSVGSGQLVLRQMLTLEPVTLRPEGYPLLLQTGGLFESQPIHDRQHPHDLFIELGAAYARPLSKSLALELYAAPVGEPALGPVAFPHRQSAFSDPIAPRGHPGQDSTHVRFGVLTAGLFTRTVKLEASWFNGREPDENRYNFDFRELDSVSGRVSFNPSADWSFQTSYGYFASPREREPQVSEHRLTASAAYHHRTAATGSFAALAVFGHSDPSVESSSSSALVEVNYDGGRRNTFFGRAEYVEKSGHDLVLPPALEAEEFPITTLAVGYVRQLWTTKYLELGLGGRVSLNWIDRELEPFYGTRTPGGYTIFLHVNPIDLAGQSR